MKPKVTLIIVHYHHPNILFACLDSIIANPPKCKFEIIVVDNDEKKTIKHQLKSKFPQAIYLKSPGNIGYGSGNNLGASKASGKFLFFLNPDTKLLSNSVDPLIKFLDSHSKAVAAAPLLTNAKAEIYQYQGTSQLTPLKAIFSLSFLHRLWPNNPISKRYWVNARALTKPTQVATVPGSAFLIRKKIFDSVKGFDQNFFLYFEESDLSQRLESPMFLIPEAKLIHHWAKLTPKTKKIYQIFQASRYYYFKKHFNLIQALIVEMFCRTSLTQISLGLILLLATYLRFYRLPELMTFIGDQGHDYLIARDMALTGRPALVGIASSVPWLYQGPLFIWLTALALKLGSFHPVAPAVLTAILGVLAAYFIFKLTKSLTAALIMAFSPLAIVHSRLAYHISPIPLFSALYLLALQQQSVAWAFFLSGILLQFELTTLPLLFFTIIILFKHRRQFWPKALFFLIPFIPKLVFDLTHNFQQTLGFVAWAGYRTLSFFGFSGQHTASFQTIKQTTLTIFHYFQKFTFWDQPLLALAFGLIAIIGLFKNKLILGFVLINFLGFYLHGSPSEAYFPILFPAFAISLSLGLKEIKPKLRLFCLLGFSLYSTYYLFSHQFIPYGPTMTERITQVNLIKLRAKNQPVQLVNPINIKFDSYSDNYRYLLWWYHVPQAPASRIKFMIDETQTLSPPIGSTTYHFPTSNLIKL